MPGGSDAKLTPTAIKRAAAARVKYRVQSGGGSMTIAPMQVGPHPLNRNGVGVNGSRCDSLLKVVLGSFEYSEASHDAVCIEAEPGSTQFYDFNLEAKIACMKKSIS